jgi:hypothetical protein
MMEGWNGFIDPPGKLSESQDINPTAFANCK